MVGQEPINPNTQSTAPWLHPLPLLLKPIRPTKCPLPKSALRSKMRKVPLSAPSCAHASIAAWFDSSPHVPSRYPFFSTPQSSQSASSWTPSPPTSAHLVAAAHGIRHPRLNNAMTSKIVKDGPAPPSLATNPAAIAFQKAHRSGPSYT